MKHREIEQIIKKRFDKINTALDSVRLHLLEDDIRIFRVKVKKLEACLGLINAEKNSLHALKLPQKIAKIFKICGVVRCLQMQHASVQKTLDSHHITSPDTYLKLVSDKILTHLELANKHLRGEKPFEKEEGKLFKLLPDHLSERAIEHFIRSEGDTLEKLFAPVFPADKSLHETRKLLKTLLYISPYIEMPISAILPYSLLSSRDKVDAFTVILGSFHDINTAIETLHTDCLKIKIEESEKTALRNIESIWIKEREAIRKEIFNQLLNIISSKQTAEPLADWPVM